MFRLPHGNLLNSLIKSSIILLELLVPTIGDVDGRPPILFPLWRKLLPPSVEVDVFNESCCEFFKLDVLPIENKEEAAQEDPEEQGQEGENEKRDLSESDWNWRVAKD